MTTLQPKAREAASTVETMDFHSDGRLYAVDLATNTAKFDWLADQVDVSFGTELGEEMASFEGKWVMLSGIATFDDVEDWMMIDVESVREEKRCFTVDEILSWPPVPAPPPSGEHVEFVTNDPFDVDDFLEAIYESSRGRSWKESSVSYKRRRESDEGCAG